MPVWKTIVVTLEHKSEGKRGCVKTCPVALAFKEAFPDAFFISTSYHNTVVYPTVGSYMVYRHPDRLRQMIVDFDYDGSPIKAGAYACEEVEKFSS